MRTKLNENVKDNTSETIRLKSRLYLYLQLTAFILSVTKCLLLNAQYNIMSKISFVMHSVV